MFDQPDLPPASLEFSNVTLQRGQNVLFENLSFKLQSGQILWVMGDNGIGKTSILKLAIGTWRPSDGMIKYEKSEKPSDTEHTIAYLGHLDAFEPLLTAREALEFWADTYSYDEDPAGLFDLVGLSEQTDVRTGNLSAGQKRRLSLARMIMARRPIWVMDEPKAAMDKQGQVLIEALLSRHIKSGGSALVATHDQAHPLGENARRIILEAPS